MSNPCPVNRVMAAEHREEARSSAGPSVAAAQLGDLCPCPLCDQGTRVGLAALPVFWLLVLCSVTAGPGQQGLHTSRPVSHGSAFVQVPAEALGVSRYLPGTQCSRL